MREEGKLNHENTIIEDPNNFLRCDKTIYKDNQAVIMGCTTQTECNNCEEKIMELANNKITDCRRLHYNDQWVYRIKFRNARECKRFRRTWIQKKQDKYYDTKQRKWKKQVPDPILDKLNIYEYNTSCHKIRQIEATNYALKTIRNKIIETLNKNHHIINQKQRQEILNSIDNLLPAINKKKNKKDRHQSV